MVGYEDNLREWREFAIEYTNEYGFNNSMSSTYIIDEPEEGELRHLCEFIANFAVSLGWLPTIKSSIQFIDWKVYIYHKPEDYFINQKLLVTLDDKSVDFDIWDGEKFEKYENKIIAWADQPYAYGVDPYAF